MHASIRTLEDFKAKERKKERKKSWKTKEQEEKNNVSNILNIRVLKVRGAYDNFPDFFRMGTFIDSKHMKL